MSEILRATVLAEFCEAHEGTEHMWAHSGIVGCADAILLDLEANGILRALLDKVDTTPEQQAAERCVLTVWWTDSMGDSLCLRLL